MTIFPESMGGFQRVAIFREDTISPERGAEYRMPHPTGFVSAHVYLYPAVAVRPPGHPHGTLPPGAVPLIQKDFDKHKSALRESHPGIQALMETQVATTAWDPPRNGKLAVFEYQDPSMDKTYRAELWVYPTFSARWALRYIFTYPKEYRAAPAIAAFKKNIPLSRLVGLHH